MRRWSGSAGAIAGVAGALLLLWGSLLLRELPGSGASALDVYAYFLDHRGEARTGAGVSIVGLALLVPFLASLRIGESARRGPAAVAMLSCGALAVGAATFSAAAVGGLAVGAANADPGTSRTILDLASGLGAAAGPLFAVALLAAAALAAGSGAPRWLPALWGAAALGCLLWLAPLVSDAEALQPGTALGTFAGVAGLLLWTSSAALLSLRRRRQPSPAAAQ